MKDRKESSDFFKVILGSIADGVFTVDSKRIITSINCSAEKITGVTASQAIGKHCYDVLQSDICEYCHIDRNFSSNHTCDSSHDDKNYAEDIPWECIQKN